MNMVGHLFQNYDTIYVRFFPTYQLQSFLLHDIRAFFCHVYLRSFLVCWVFIPKYMTIFLETRIYYKQACGIWGHRKSSYKRHRIIPSAKPHLCTMELRFLVRCNISKRFCLQWKAFDLLYKMGYILWVVALLEAVTSPNMVSILDFIKH